MTNLETRAANLRPHLILEELLARHGTWQVLRALLKAHNKQRLHRRLDAAALSNHLRRDMGLPPQDAPPRLMR